MEGDVPRDRALVVDDNDDISELLAMLLRRHGYLVETTSSASEALAKFPHGGTASFCLIVSDIGMPGMNGYELARKLRKLPQCKKVAMLAVTGFSIYGDRKRALDAGFDDLMVKPISPLSLIATIERLRKRRK